MSQTVRRTTIAVLTAAALVGVLAGCGADNPPGTLGEDDLPSGVEVSKVTHDVQANQAECQAVNDAEDNHVVSVSSNYNKDNEAAVSYALKGSGKEYLADSVWLLRTTEAAVAQVIKGLDACVRDHPDNYARVDVKGYPRAMGYAAQEGSTFSRRIMVPLKDRVVTVSISRQGDDKFSVTPDALLAKAVKAASAVPG